MAYRYSCKNAAITTGGTTFAHGLGATPDEWFFNQRLDIFANGGLYLTAAPTSTNIIVAAASGATSGDVFCSVTHSLVS